VLVLLGSCTASTRVISGPDFTAYQSRDNRLYLSWISRIGWAANDEAQARVLYQRSLEELGPLFIQGVVSANSIYRALPGTPPDERRKIPPARAFGTFEVDLQHFSGHSVKVINYRILPVPGQPSRRDLELWVDLFDHPGAESSYLEYHAILENPKATSSTSFADFVQNARLLSMECFGEIV
jgi:hypothetical protein